MILVLLGDDAASLNNRFPSFSAPCLKPLVYITTVRCPPYSLALAASTDTK